MSQCRRGTDFLFANDEPVAEELHFGDLVAGGVADLEGQRSGNAAHGRGAATVVIQGDLDDTTARWTGRG